MTITLYSHSKWGSREVLAILWRKCYESTFDHLSLFLFKILTLLFSCWDCRLPSSWCGRPLPLLTENIMIELRKMLKWVGGWNWPERKRDPIRFCPTDHFFVRSMTWTWFWTQETQTLLLPTDYYESFLDRKTCLARQEVRLEDSALFPFFFISIHTLLNRGRLLKIRMDSWCNKEMANYMKRQEIEEEEGVKK